MRSTMFRLNGSGWSDCSIDVSWSFGVHGYWMEAFDEKWNVATACVIAAEGELLELIHLFRS